MRRLTEGQRHIPKITLKEDGEDLILYDISEPLS